ncbi:hypothetical protein [Collimonas fungivorans]|uniref:hypothetical protein n=1 Tax=Collimonas fungivorans TaxID=158899 RepID=UPI000302FFD8|nr:hypothetical protein [Collimonas fungivorans]
MSFIPTFAELAALILREWLADYLVVREQPLFKAEYCMRPEVLKFLDMANGMAGEW